jgi:hypothetical protein
MIISLRLAAISASPRHTLQLLYLRRHNTPQQQPYPTKHSPNKSRRIETTGLISITSIVPPRIVSLRIAAKRGVIDIPQRWRRRNLQAMVLVNLCFVEFVHKRVCE